MKERNKNNRIVFLTTLSVYLGLVLVGGAPSVSAQAILSNKTEAKIGYLTDEKILDEYVSIFRNLFVLSKDFSVNYPKELNYPEEWKAAENGKIKENEYWLNCFYNVNPDFSQTVKGIDGRLVYSGKFVSSLEKLSKVFPHTIEESKSQLKINLALTDDNFSLKVIAYQDSDKQAEQIFNSYTNELSRIKIQQTNRSRIIYQNTEIFKENNQLIIATRLPRGALDELLKQDAKAESK